MPSATMLAGWKKSSRIDACTYRVYQQHRSTTAGGSRQSRAVYLDYYGNKAQKSNRVCNIG